MSETETRMERADTRFHRSADDRRIKVPGAPEYYGGHSPITIARVLRSRSKLGEMERRLGKKD